MKKFITQYKWLIIILTIFALLVLITAILITNKQPSSKDSNLTIITSSKSHILTVEFAETSQERAKGLMYRTELCENCGMLFIFPDEQTRTFWMKNTLIPLDIIFADSEGNIINIAKNTKVNQTEEKYSSQYPAKYILEVNANWSERNNVEIGDMIELLQAY